MPCIGGSSVSPPPIVLQEEMAGYSVSAQLLEFGLLAVLEPYAIEYTQVPAFAASWAAVIASWHWSFEPKEIVSPQPTPPKLMVSPLATSLEKTIVSPVATLLVEKVMVVPLATLACCETVTVFPLTLVTVVLAATPLPVTVMPVVGVPVKELKLSVVLLLVAPLVTPVTAWPIEFDIVTVLPLKDTMVVPLGIAELLVVSVTPIPVVMFVGNDARVKVLLGARVGALV